MSDLFPKVIEKTIDYSMLLEAITQSVDDMGLAPVEGSVKLNNNLI